MKLFPNFTRHHMITHTELNFNIIVDHKNVKQNKTKKKRVSAGEFVYNRNRGRWLFIQSPLQKWGEHQTYSWGHVKHDYLIKYACFVKCYLERFASISDPEKRATNVAQQTNKQTNKKTWNLISNKTWHYFVNKVTKRVFLNGEELQTLILWTIITKRLHKLCNL